MEDTDASREWRSLLLPLSMSIAAHVFVVAALLWLSAQRSDVGVGPSPILADLVELADTPPQPKASTPEADVQPKPQARAPVAISEEPVSSPNTSDVLSESQLAEVMSAGSEGGAGAGGGGCDMVQALQHALQRDPKVHEAVESANRQGKAIMLWNGDWVRSGDQDGKGLSVVREVVMWELAFAPEACRSKPMRGPVLLSLADGSTRFVIGIGEWRWSDLLGLHRR